MFKRGRKLVQLCIENEESPNNVEDELENRIISPLPGSSFLSEFNITEPSYHIPTDLDSTMAVDDSVADPDFVVAPVENSDTRCESTVSIQTNDVSMNTSVDYDHDFNHLLFIGTNRTSSPNDNESPPQPTTVFSVTNVNEENNNPTESSVHSPSILNVIADSQVTDSPIIYVNEEIDNISTKSAKIARKEKKRKDDNVMQRKIKHPINLEKCSTCPNSCSQFEEETRREIWNNYWEVTYTERRKWLASCIKTVNIQRRRVPVDEEGNNEFRKKASRIYSLKKDGVDLKVCLSFLLKTLGYSSDSVIMELAKAMKKGALNLYVKENRGRKKGKLCNYNLIEAHINSYNPVVAHYRRHNAPNMRYMPPGLTVNMLYEDFKNKHPKATSKETYRKILKDLGISLKTPACDICADCALYEKIKSDYVEKGEVVPDDKTEKYETHKMKASEAIDEYKNDSKAEENTELKIFSMDLQKVLLIPHMPKVKEAFFISRLIAFNETFASLKKNSEGYCIVWHEGVAGRDAPQIVDAITTFLKEERDVQNFIIWMDNCSAQNKNWYLYTAMIHIVNSNIVSENLQSVTFKYLTKGHTHMSADGIHGNIEKQIRKSDVYDFRDLVGIIKKARKNIKVVPISEFHNWQKKKRQPRKDNDKLKDFSLKNVVLVKFERGLRELQFKESFSDVEYILLNFLQPRFDITKTPDQILEQRGINPIKKRNIIDKLCKLMPNNRITFWHTMAENNNVVDLVTGGQIDQDET